jgi:hypothetical protein
MAWRGLSGIAAKRYSQGYGIVKTKLDGSGGPPKVMWLKPDWSF